MSDGTTVCFYLVIGIGVATAMWLGNTVRLGPLGFFQILSVPLFWPIYLPMLLTRRTQQSIAGNSVVVNSGSECANDVMASLIVQVECELDAAIRGLNGWAENVLSGEQHRIAEIKNAWRQQAGHIRELDQLLIQAEAATNASMLQRSDKPRSDASMESVDVSETAPKESDRNVLSAEKDIERPARVFQHERSRSGNIIKLKQVRQQMYDDLLSTLAWVRELVTMIHLAKYTGAPASQALDLVQQVAAAVERLSKVNRVTPGSSV